MKEWLIFILFMLVGLGMLISGIVYMYKEKNDPESLKIYRVASSLGAVLIVVSVLVKFVF
ncbi:hypothetical protein REC12_03155 [Desulfosporosinus sp. PR]|uniref:hypothetical protein n=1 Tax=Candidatus Desulfosporosinus nitrosoreducens TaxID=3401928 RepID=UPI0027FA3115|nr:hypothetical protein [Desulfosporosinus sp. PR]MDQ7092583.1 hypothetical protein [Desulfosporosinus sp. PR]